MAVAAARWARELRVRGRQRVRGSRASRAGVLVIPVIVFGGHEDLFRLFLGLLRLQRFRSIASFVGVRIAFRLISYFCARGAPKFSGTSQFFRASWAQNLRDADAASLLFRL